jgi:hypothetical protein
MYIHTRGDVVAEGSGMFTQGCAIASSDLELIIMRIGELEWKKKKRWCRRGRSVRYKERKNEKDSKERRRRNKSVNMKRKPFPDALGLKRRIQEVKG